MHRLAFGFMPAGYAGWLFWASNKPGAEQMFRLPILRHGDTMFSLKAARQRAITMVKEVGPVKVIEKFITKKIVPALMPIHRVSG